MSLNMCLTVPPGNSSPTCSHLKSPLLISSLKFTGAIIFESLSQGPPPCVSTFSKCHLTGQNIIRSAGLISLPFHRFSSVKRGGRVCLSPPPVSLPPLNRRAGRPLFSPLTSVRGGGVSVCVSLSFCASPARHQSIHREGEGGEGTPSRAPPPNSDGLSSPRPGPCALNRFDPDQEREERRRL